MGVRVPPTAILSRAEAFGAICESRQRVVGGCDVVLVQCARHGSLRERRVIPRTFSGGVSNADTTSVLKLLKRNVEIGSTVDPGNGDQAPYGIAIVPGKKGLTKGQLLACNIADQGGTAGNGTTIEVLDPTPGSSPATFAHSPSIAGCDGVTIDSLNTVFATAYTAKDVVTLSSSGSVQKKFSGHSIKVPFGNVFAMQGKHYQAAYDFIADALTGSVLSLSYDRYGTGKAIQVATGFAVNKQDRLARSGHPVCSTTRNRIRCISSTASTTRSSRSRTRAISS